MMHRLSLAACLIAAAAGGAAVAQPAPGATFTVRNDSDEVLECAIKKAGSGIAEELRLNPGQQWTRGYAKPKARNFRCLGAAPIWYVMKPGLVYRLAPNRDGLIVLTLATR